MKAATTAAMVFAFAAPSAALADVVVYHQSGTTDSVFLEDLLPGAGQYKFEITSSIPTSNFFLTTGWVYHWDVFYAPAPKPHSENITGNEVEEAFVLDVSTGSDLFEVPETTYTFYLSGPGEAIYGVPSGTPVYREDKYETPHFALIGSSPTGGPFDFDFKITKLGATATVPEPTAWALMILGFGAVGATLRRRKEMRVAA